MILVDTSIWIELLNRKIRTQIPERELLQFRTCGPVLQEVLQGMRNHPAEDAFRQVLLSLAVLSNPLPSSTFIFAAEIYRMGRRKAYTVRSSIDCLIAAIAIENRATVWHRDRDFELIAKYTGLISTQQI